MPEDMLECVCMHGMLCECHACVYVSMHACTHVAHMQKQHACAYPIVRMPMDMCDWLFVLLCMCVHTRHVSVCAQAGCSQRIDRVAELVQAAAQAVL